MIIRNLRLLFFLVLALGPLRGWAFEVLDATVYSARSNSAEPGFKRIAIVDTHQLWDGKEGSDAPDVERLSRALNNVTPNEMVVIDVEHWATTGANVTSTIEKFRRLIANARAARSDLRIGLYSTVPRRDYWRAIGAQGADKRAEWNKENDQLAPLAALVDVLFPCAYTFYPDEAGWRRYASAQIAEARRLAPGKPVYLFIWPEYHDSTSHRGTYLTASYWKTQLDLACEQADGVVIWGGWNYATGGPRTWDPAAPWWIETRKFIERAGACGKAPR